MGITSKGQVTIPQRIRQQYHLSPGTEVEFLEENGRVWLRPAQTEGAQTPLARFRGTADVGMSTDEILALTRSES
jgi:AbrB family looped-hinge helix DNA binding protein